MQLTRVKLVVAAVVALFTLTSNCGTSGPEERPGTVFVSGRIEGDETNLAPKLSGRIVEIIVREGEDVKAAEVVARLSGKQILATRNQAQAQLVAARRRIEQSRGEVRVLQQRVQQVELQRDQASLDAQGRVAQSESQLAATRAELVRAAADLEQDKADAKRYAVLAEKGAVPTQQAEQLATKVKTSEARVEASRRQMAAAEGALKISKAVLRNPEIRTAEIATLKRQTEEAESRVRLAKAESKVSEALLEKAEADVEDLSVTAPFDGTIIVRAAEPGQVVNAGTTLLTMVDMKKLYLRGFVPEGQIGHVKVRQPAEIYLDSAPDTPIPAEVMRVDPVAMFTPENTYFQKDRVKQVVGVKLLLKGGYGNAKIGMPADAYILIEEQRPKEQSQQ